jgi:hypothetical protein
LQIFKYKNSLHLLGFLSKALNLLRGALILYLILKFLDSEDQGIWYTFLSLGALSTLADLGFTTLIAQYISHDFAYLNFSGIIVNNSSELKYFKGLLSTIKFAFKHFTFFVLLFFSISLIGGALFFYKDGLGIVGLWVLYTMSGAFNLYLSFMQNVIIGLNRIREIHRVNIAIGLFIISVLIVLKLYNVFDIKTMVYLSLTTSILPMIYMTKKYWNLWIQIIRSKYKISSETKDSLFTLQKRYAVSWTAGYVAYHLSTPLIFKFLGSVVAGQIGMTLSLLSTFSGLAMIFVTNYIPQYSMFNAKGEFKLSYQKFFASCKLMLGIYFLQLLVFLVIYYFYSNFFDDRIVQFSLLLVMSFTVLIQLIVSAIGVYLKSFREDLLYPIAVIGAILSVTFSFIFIPYQNLSLFLYVNLTIHLIVILPLTVAILFRKIKSLN